jgi:NitT/TauT family transport system substrate-binding protein
MPFSMRHSSLLLLYFLLTGMVLTSCSGFATKAPTNSMTLKVAQNTNAACFFPLYVAEQKNYFQAQGLTLDPPVPPILGNGTKVTAAMESGSIEMAGGGVITDAFTLASIDWQVKLLGTLTSGFVNDIVVSKKFEQQANLSATSTLAEKVKALVGKKIGTTGPRTGTEALVVYLFRIFGYDASRDAHLINVGSTNAAMLAALSSGRVDAISYFPPGGQSAEIRGIGNIYISPVRGDIPAMRGQVHCVFYTRQAVIDSKPQAVWAFIRAIAQAEAFIHQNQAQSILLLQKDLKLDLKTTKAVFAVTLPIIPESPQIDQQGYNAANQFHVEAGLITIALPYKDMVATSTIDTALSGMQTSP